MIGIVFCDITYVDYSNTVYGVSSPGIQNPIWFSVNKKFFKGLFDIF